MNHDNQTPGERGSTGNGRSPEEVLESQLRKVRPQQVNVDFARIDALLAGREELDANTPVPATSSAPPRTHRWGAIATAWALGVAAGILLMLAVDFGFEHSAVEQTATETSRSPATLADQSMDRDQGIKKAVVAKKTQAADGSFAPTSPSFRAQHDWSDRLLQTERHGDDRVLTAIGWRVAAYPNPRLAIRAPGLLPESAGVDDVEHESPPPVPREMMKRLFENEGSML